MRRVEIILELIVRVIEPGSHPGVEVVTSMAVYRRHIRTQPLLSIGMTLSNEGHDDTTEFGGFRVDALRMEVSKGIVVATMNIRTDKQSAAKVVDEWRAMGWTGYRYV